MNRNFHFAGVSLTLLLHLGLIGLIVAKEGWGGGAAAADDSGFEDAETIEAALAFKKVEKKSNQPQKQKKKKFKPKTERKLSRDSKAEPTEDKEEPLPPKPDEIDTESILEKNRRQDPDLSETGVEELPQEGALDGSEWGTEKEAKGHPYVGELKGRIYKVWNLPQNCSEEGAVYGCVKLDEDGTIRERALKQKSSNSCLNRSVYLALKDATDMEDPIPDEHAELLTERGICFNFDP